MQRDSIVCTSARPADLVCATCSAIMPLCSQPCALSRCRQELVEVHNPAELQAVRIKAIGQTRERRIC
jgi:hypothetical protein